MQNPKIKLEQLTIYNNNIGDEGAIKLAEAFKGNKFIRAINLQMNFIRDMGASCFVDGVKANEYENI